MIPHMTLTRICLILIIARTTLQSSAQAKIDRSPFNISVDERSRFVSFEVGIPSTTNLAYNHAIDSIFHLKKNYDFEFRLWKRYRESNFDNVFILTLKDDKWKARYFDRNNGADRSSRFKERKVDQTKLNQLWMLLVENKLLTLPDQEELKDRMVTYLLDPGSIYFNKRTTHFIDGVLFAFELSAPDKVRHFAYGNPESYTKYTPHVEEFFRVVIIDRLIKMVIDE